MSVTLEAPPVTRQDVQALIDEIDEWLKLCAREDPTNWRRINKFLDQRIEYMKVRDRL